MKRQGTNTYYTASIVNVTDINTGKLTAIIYHTHTHYGHEIGLGHIPLHTSTRMELEANNTQGVSTKHIQDWRQHPKYFMIDDAEQFYNTWTSIFGKITQTSKLICTWHVD